LKKVAISACLLGELCRYDGKTKIDNNILTAFASWEIIPFCPEAPLFGTPRERISILHVNDQKRVISDETNKDVTQALQEWTQKFITMHPDLDAIVLKSKSPSCGLGTTPILNSQREIIGFGDGISAQLFKEMFKNIQILDEIAFAVK